MEAEIHNRYKRLRMKIADIHIAINHKFSYNQINFVDKNFLCNKEPPRNTCANATERSPVALSIIHHRIIFEITNFLEDCGTAWRIIK